MDGPNRYRVIETTPTFQIDKVPNGVKPSEFFQSNLLHINNAAGQSRRGGCSHSLGATSTRYQLQSMLDNSPRQAAKTKSAETFCDIGMIFVTIRTTITYLVSYNLFYQHNPPFRPHRQIVSTLLNGLWYTSRQLGNSHIRHPFGRHLATSFPHFQPIPIYPIVYNPTKS